MKKNLANILYIFALALMSCVQHHHKVIIEDFNTPIYTPKYASGFQILALPDSSALLLKISKPWQGAAINNHHLIITNEEVEPLQQQGHAAASLATIAHEAKRIIVLSSTNVAMLDAIGQCQRIVGVSGVEYISNQEVQSGYERREVLDIGYGTNLNFEAIVALRPDIVLLYGVAGEEVSVTSKLRELGIQYIYVGDYAEESPLGKAEWMVAMGVICGNMDVATELFEAIEGRYNALKESIKAGKRPKVMLNTPYRDVWYMPSLSSYMVRLIEDAGGEYIYRGNATEATQPISLEAAYGLVREADVWLNLGMMVRTVEALRVQNPLFADMEVVKRGELYNATARSTAAGGSDFWESGVVRPDVVLRDLISIFYPEQRTKGGELFYYERLE